MYLNKILIMNIKYTHILQLLSTYTDCEINSIIYALPYKFTFHIKILRMNSFSTELSYENIITIFIIIIL